MVTCREAEEQRKIVTLFYFDWDSASTDGDDIFTAYF
jgi:hypothetical protein